MTTEQTVERPQRDPALQGLGPGRIVHVTGWNGTRGARAAIVVHDWEEAHGSCNLLLFPDGSNDIPYWSGHLIWLTAVPYGPLAAAGYSGAVWNWPTRANGG